MSTRQSEYLAPVSVAFLSFCLYFYCLAPSVATGGDCGELIAASYRLGIAHPSGYALYCLTGKFFATIFPFGEVAWRYNLFSACCGAATCGLVALLVQRLLQTFTISNSSISNSANIWAACGAGFLLAGFTFFGAQALIAEVYAPTGFITALIFLCAFNWACEPRLLWLGALGGVLGLALNLHLSVVFLGPGFLVFLILAWRAQSSAVRSRSILLKATTIFALCFLAGISITLYLPLRAATFPEPIQETIGGQKYSWGQALDWGHPVDFPRWKAHILVQQYKSLLFEPTQFSVLGREITLRRFTQTPQAALRQLLDLASAIALQFLWSTPLILIGAIQSLRARSTPGRALAALFAFTFIINVLVAIHYRVDNIFDIVNFLFPAYVVMAIWMGLGIAWFLKSAEKWGRKLDGETPMSGGWGWRFSTIAKLLIVGAIITQWIFFVTTASWRGNTRAKDATILRADAVEKLQEQTGRAPSLLLFSDDTLFPFWYAQKVLGKASNARTPWGAAMHAFEDQKKLPQLAAKLLQTGPVATSQWRADLDAKFPYAPLTRNGNLWRLTTGVLPPPARLIKKRNTEAAGVLRARWLQKEIRRGEITGLELDFIAPAFAFKRRWLRDLKNQSRQIGFVEILVRQQSLLMKLARDQQSMPLGNTLPIFTQSRRLAVPIKISQHQILRAILPLEFPIEMPPGDYKVWARIVPTPSHSGMEWKKVDSMRLIVR